MDINKNTERKGWDNGLNFEYVKKRLIEDLKTERLKRNYAGAIGVAFKKGNRIAYNSILLIQLLNGSRIGEAVEAAFAFLDNGLREQKVKVEKHKTEVYRLIIIPDAIKRSDLSSIEGSDAEKVKNAVKAYAIRHFRFNTHSLRYAFITHLAIEQKQPVNLVARITEHSNINMLTRYIEQTQADDVLRKIINES